MRLFEMNPRPTRAGRFPLIYGAFDTPRTFERSIFLPNRPFWEFFPLKEGWKHFLVVGGLTVASPFQAYFCGDDEHPFVTPLEAEPFHAFLRSGGNPNAFYNSLKPGLISRLERKHGVKARRQGDFWAVRIPSLRELSTIIPGFSKSAIKTAAAEPVLDTPHTVTGKVLPLFLFFADPVACLAEGRLEIPGRKPLVLRGPHLLMRSLHLKDGGAD
ncbi:MAG: hypothetical protein HY520_03870 [Candidatus Aenigmarchaeota archaeon]|nr:hypothetical protein [Candidatus Aenigmarchaeota archaeon]